MGSSTINIIAITAVLGTSILVYFMIHYVVLQLLFKIIIGFLLVISFLFAIGSLQARIQNSKENNWLIIKGTIVYSGIFTNKRDRSSKPAFSYVVLFTYEVSGARFNGFINVGGINSGSKNWALKKISGYTEGIEVDVSYDQLNLEKRSGKLDKMKEDILFANIPDDVESYPIGSGTVTPGRRPLGTTSGIIISWIIFLLAFWVLYQFFSII